jgi:protein phosphatase
MGTTLMMAVQLPQSLSTDQGRGNTHELYLVHVGDSRAYWLSATGCQQLTVDDDVAHREVRSGRSLYSQVLDRPDAAALTQALGTREANGLKITVQRFILDHDGVLLLCSDGLSDNALVEQHWQTVMQPVLENRLTLQTAAQTWIDLANRHNGHDNASLVLMHCQLKTVFSAPALLTETADSAQLTESARVLLYEEQNASDLPRKAAVLPKFKPVAQSAIDGWVVAIGVGALMFVLGALGVAIWRELAPTGFRPEHPSNSTPNPAHVEGQD